MDDKRVNEEHEYLLDEIISVVLDNFDGLLSRKAAESVSADVVNWLDNEGWLVALEGCQKKEYDTNAYSCDNTVARPGDDFCPQHSE